MARPKHEHPTPAELEVLQILWRRGPSTVREVLETLDRKPAPAYTSLMSLLNVMSEKKLLVRKPKGRAFVYAPRANRDKTLGKLVGDMLKRAFAGSPSSLVARLLEQANPTPDELEEIRKTIVAYQRDPKSEGGAK